MNSEHLHEALERATDAVAPVGMAADALATARRRRVQRRGALAGLVAAAAVSAVVAATQGVAAMPWGDRSAAPMSPGPTPASPTSASDSLTFAPPIEAGRIQPVWDPRDVEGLRNRDLGMSPTLPGARTGTVTTAVALLDDGQEQTMVVGRDGVAQALNLPAGLGRQRTVQLSPDGSRVAAVGITGFFWRELDGGDWRRVEVPDTVTGEGIELTWLPGSGSLVLRSHLPGVRIDLETDGQRELPELNGYVAWAADPAGLLTYTPRRGELVSQEPDGESRSVIITPLESLQRLIVSATSLAAARANSSIASPPAVDDRDGLIALDRDTLATRGYLPVRDSSSSYVDGGALSARAWLDDDTVLFSVHPLQADEAHLVTWDVESGELRRVTSWSGTYSASFATELLREP